MLSRPPLSSLIAFIASRTRIDIGWPSGSALPHLKLNSAASAGQRRMVAAAMPAPPLLSSLLRDKFIDISPRIDRRAYARRLGSIRLLAKGVNRGHDRSAARDGGCRNMTNWSKVAGCGIPPDRGSLIAAADPENQA